MPGGRGITASPAGAGSGSRASPRIGPAGSPRWPACSRPRPEPVSLRRQFARGLRALIHPGAADRDVADEVQHFLEQAAAAHRARGLSPEAALRAARMELGGVRQVREEVRSSGWESFVGTVLADLRYAARRLAPAARGRPGTAAT